MLFKASFFYKKPSRTPNQECQKKKDFISRSLDVVLPKPDIGSDQETLLPTFIITTLT